MGFGIITPHKQGKKNRSQVHITILRKQSKKKRARFQREKHGVFQVGTPFQKSEPAQLSGKE